MKRVSKVGLIVITLMLNACRSAPESYECGRVSTFLKPPVTQNLYPALVTHIDGKPVLSQPNYHLLPGEYELKVVELISAPSYEVPLTERQAKVLKIQVIPGQAHHLAAKHQQHGETFWQPLIWQTTPVSCQLSASIK